jgi:hydrogenase-4 component B
VTELLAAIAIALAASSGLLGLLAPRGSAFSARAPVVVMVAAGVAGIGAAVRALSGHASEGALPWHVPGGAIAFRIDALAAMFVLQIFVIGPLGAIYGLAYWTDAEHPGDARKVRTFYGLVVAGMTVLVIARNAILFLVGWEVMALAAFVLVSAEDGIPAVRRAGLVYLIATRVGTLCLFALFTLLRSVNGSFDLHAPAIDASRPIVTAMLVLALLGFGLKAGAMPLHVWLPGAHANAPSHVSALMSGVLIKMGIYPLVRFLGFFPAPPSWWGMTVLAIGLVSGVLGVAFAIGQHDLKRLLAYHSVENIGIILIGLGVGLLGRSAGDEAIFALGVGGALLHVWNHGLFKALLFLSAGSVLHATGTREIDRLGGLARSMPKTTLAFVLGAVAICGLPPLNGFVSELLVYLGLVRACTHASGTLFVAGAFGAPALALIGALAVACFVKVFGAVFLGEPRTEDARHAHESGRAMLVPMAALGLACATIGLGPRLIAPALDASIATLPHGALAPVSDLAPLSTLTPVGLALVVMIAACAWVVLRPRAERTPPARVGTWDCGYAAPTARMQYTSSSFAASIVALFSGALRPERHDAAVVGLFPRAATFHSHVPEVVLDRAVTPTFRLVARVLGSFRWVQRGSVHLYLLYILVTLVLALIIWR